MSMPFCDDSMVWLVKAGTVTIAALTALSVAVRKAGWDCWTTIVISFYESFGWEYSWGA